jgi:hypothetical protein
MSQSGPLSSHGGGGGGITTIDGDIGSITGSTVTIFTNQATLNSGSSIEFVNSGTISTLNVTDANGNTIVGNLSGTTTAAVNQTADTGFGFSVFTALDPAGAGGNFCSAFGWNTLHSVTTGNFNSAFGSTALFSVTTQNHNSAFGYNVATGYNDTNLSAFGSLAFNSLVSGQANSGFGQGAFSGLTTGSFNCGFGASVGSSYSGAESSNILIMSAGVNAESNTIRIGTQGNGNGQQDLCFIAGITGVTTSNSNFVTIDTTTGQLGAVASGGGITTIDGDTGSVTGSTITIFANQAANNCGASVLFSNSGSTSTLNVTDISNNTFIGTTCGNTTLSGNSNIGLGSNILSVLTTGSNNNALGRNNLNLCTTGNNNSAFGSAALDFLVTGSDNIGLGNAAGSAYTGAESSNIVIGNLGTLGDNNTIRIGSQGAGLGQQNTCFIAGITGVTVSNQEFVTINTSTGQLGTSSAGFATTYTNVTSGMSPYTVTPTDQYISCDTSGGAITLNFPNAPTANREWVVKDRTGNSAANNITVTTPGGVVTIDGSTTYLLNTAFMAINLLANSTPTYEVF